MIVRAIALSLALLVGIGVLIPLATNDAEAGPRHRKHRKHRHYKKYSKGWWRQYHARMKRKRAIAARKRALRLRQLRLARAAGKTPGSSNTSPVKGPASAAAPTVLPSGNPAPTGWTPSQSSPAELQFRVDNSSGSQVGSASISVVGPAVNQVIPAGKAIGGVPMTSLRREVIDKMIRENGWVLNDYQKVIGGQQVYVVEAQSQARGGGVQSRVFYFTEVDGRIYNVATNSPTDQAERLAEESEKVINSLKARVRPTERASTKN